MEQHKIIRPWGAYIILNKTESHWVKKLFIDKNARTSLQSHELRDEIWYVLNGKITAQIGEKIHSGKSGDIFFVPRNKKHRLEGLTKNSCVLEIAYGKVLETDIMRHEDDYGRASVL